MNDKKPARNASHSDAGGDINKAPWWQPALVLFAKLSGWIIGPVLIAVIIGKWLDRKYHTAPWLFLLAVGIAFILSMVGIIRDTVREFKKIEKESLDKKTSESQNLKGKSKEFK